MKGSNRAEPAAQGREPATPAPGPGRWPVPGLDSTVDDVVRALRTRPTGLGGEEAARRLREHGRNELVRESPPSWFAILARQFKDAMVAVLLAAMAVSLVIGHEVEAAAIAAIALFTVLLGFFQEHRATRAIEALRRLSAPRANVIRDGSSVTMPTEEVVPGDVIVLAQGDIVPADGRLLDAVELQVAEASLTGESVPVAKTVQGTMAASQPVGDRTAMVHASTVVTYGRARAVVTATGSDTELGRIGKLLSGVRAEPTPLQRQLGRLARALLWIGLAAVLLVVVLGLVRGHEPVEMLLFGMAVAVAIVPEALPAVVTISLAVGAQRMAKRHALIRRLPTVETLGSTTVICTDKTGTLTLGEMAVTAVAVPTGVQVIEGSGYEPAPAIDSASVGPLAEVAVAGVLCNDARLLESAGSWAVQGDPTEGALIVLGRKAGLDVDSLQALHPRVGEVPFSSERRLMTTLHEVRREGVAQRVAHTKRVAYTKGAPEAVLARCDLVWSPDGPRPLLRKVWLEQADRMASDGLRVLALARTDDPEVLGAGRGGDEGSGMAFLGLVGMRDAPRAQAKASIALCHSAGIRTVMITGDHPLTASSVARELGISSDDRVTTGTDLEAWSDEDLRRQVDGVHVYARVSPAHKLRIVEALQHQGHVVAMTGDGVNDAPALRKADIGIAMGITGTDVSKEAAGMMLADDNFATIVAAVEEGRAIFDNIRKYLTFLLSTNLGEIVLIALTMVLGLPLPVTAVQILYVNLASDGLPALALAVEPHEEDLMRRKPRQPGKAIVDRASVTFMVLAGLVSGAVNFGVFAWALQRGLPVREAMTMVFVSLVLIQLAKAYVFRAPNRSILDRPFGNRWLNWACLWEVALLMALVYVPFFERIFGTRPMPAMHWAVILASVVAVIVILEGIKWAQRRQTGNQAKGAAAV